MNRYLAPSPPPITAVRCRLKSSVIFCAFVALAFSRPDAARAQGGANLAGNVVDESGGADACVKLTSLRFETSRITKAEVVAGGEFTPPRGVGNGEGQQAAARTMKNLPDFCRVVIHSSFSSDSSVNSELWLPLSGWNQKFLGVGNGAFAGNIAYTAAYAPFPDGTMATGVRQGFATANTDMGTHADPGEPFPAIGHPTKWLDYGYRSTHEMTVVSKDITRAFYGQAAKYSYFAGCSTGGFQALRIVQDFPDDYNGVLGGNPGNNRAPKVMGIVYNYMLPKMYPEGRIPDDKLLMMHKAVLTECAGVGGGVKTDPFLSAPYGCKWKPEALLCKSAETSNCLTQAQVDMANRFYTGLQNSRTKKQVWPGVPRGTELGWREFMVAANQRDPLYAEPIRSALGANHDFWKTDWDRDVETYIQIMNPYWDATKTNLDAFAKNGGKLLMYFGWNDSSSSYDMTDYYESVRKDIQGRHNLIEAQAQTAMEKYYRLFMLPGVEHCRNGNGPNTFDGLGALTKWVEEGVAPDTIVATYRAPTNRELPRSLGVPMSRPLCVYPRTARYKGVGDPTKADSFVCAK